MGNVVDLADGQRDLCDQRCAALGERARQSVSISGARIHVILRLPTSRASA